MGSFYEDYMFYAYGSDLKTECRISGQRGTRHLNHIKVLDLSCDVTFAIHKCQSSGYGNYLWGAVEKFPDCSKKQKKK
jgi:hypothetical protein